MRFSFFICVFVALLACSSPGYEYRGVDPVSIIADGSEFDIYISGENVRAIRTNFEALPKLSETTARATAAIELASSCTVNRNSMRGDQAMLDATISC